MTSPNQNPSNTPDKEAKDPRELRRLELERLRKMARDAELAEEEAAEARELEELQLVEQLSQGGKFKRGYDFEVVNTKFGVFGVKKPDTQGVRNWRRATEVKEPEDERLIGILFHYILPEGPKQNEFGRVAGERAGIIHGENGVAAAFMSLISQMKFDAKKK